MSKVVGKSRDDASVAEHGADLDDTASMPVISLPEPAKIASSNDAEFSSSSTADQLKRLIELAESMDQNLQRIAKSLETPTRATVKRTRRKANKKKRVSTRRKKKSST